jgi:ankyrin repeat protein
MKLRKKLMLALPVTVGFISISAADDFQSDFFKSNSQWDDVKSKKESLNSAQPPIVVTPPSVAPNNNSSSQQKNSSTPITSPNTNSATTQKSAEPLAEDKPATKDVSSPFPVSLEDLSSISDGGEVLADTPGVALDKLITISPSIEDFNKTNRSKGRKFYDHRNGIPEDFVLKSKPSDKNSHIPNYTYSSEYSQMLFSATVMGNISAIKTLLKRGADINSRIIDSGMTPLMMAVKVKNAQVLRYLITAGADLNLQNKEGQTALHISCILGLEDLFSILISSGANTAILDTKGKAAMSYVNPVLEDTFYNMLISSSKNKDVLLLNFIKTGSLKGAKIALDSGADINARDVDGSTPLIISSKNNDSKLVGFLLFNDADPNLKDKSNNSASSYASKNQNTKIEDMLETVLLKHELDTAAESLPKSIAIEPVSSEPLQVLTKPTEQQVTITRDNQLNISQDSSIQHPSNNVVPASPTAPLGAELKEKSSTPSPTTLMPKSPDNSAKHILDKEKSLGTVKNLAPQQEAFKDKDSFTDKEALIMEDISIQINEKNSTPSVDSKAPASLKIINKPSEELGLNQNVVKDEFDEYASDDIVKSSTNETEAKIETIELTTITAKKPSSLDSSSTSPNVSNIGKVPPITEHGVFLEDLSVKASLKSEPQKISNITKALEPPVNSAEDDFIEIIDDADASTTPTIAAPNIKKDSGGFFSSWFN